MVSQLVKGIIPDLWKAYTVPHGATVIQWVTDFGQKVKQLQEISSKVAQFGASELKVEQIFLLLNITVWLGGLFNPEAYITATRQCIAQANSWSLKELVLDVSIADVEGQVTQAGGFNVKGLKLQGAVCKSNAMHLSHTIMTELPNTTLQWVHAGTATTEKITLPVYLNATRSDILSTVDLAVGPGEIKYNYYERGVALLASTNLN